MNYTFAVMGCQHLGYRQPRMNRLHHSGLNLREVDGYIAHRLTVEQMLTEGVSGIIDGGDIYHVAAPGTDAINTALRVDDLRVDAGDDDGPLVWRITNGGNHDNGSGRHRSAVATLHRPHLGSYAVFPDAKRNPAEQVTPYPGYYEIHQPDPDVPLYIHMVSHNGLDPQLAQRGITIEPRPIDGGINILCAHGIFAADGRMFGADDRHGAQRIIPTEWAHRGFDHYLLSDYHTLGPIPGFGPDDGYHTGQVWMTGSALRRGFSDDECGRGWLHVTIGDNGHVTVEPRYIWQRPQIDFPALDAADLSVEDIDAEVQRRLAAQPLWDAASAELTGDGGYILRQRILNASVNQKPALRAAATQWAAIADKAAAFTVAYINDTAITAHRSDPKHTPDIPHITSYVDQFTRRSTGGGVVARTLEAMTTPVRDQVHQRTCAVLADLATTPTD